MSNPHSGSTQVAWPDLNRLANASGAAFCANALDVDSANANGEMTGTAMNLLLPARGQVALITKIVGSVVAARENNGGVAPFYKQPNAATPSTTPNISRIGRTFDALYGGQPAQVEHLDFFNFDRNAGTFGTSPDTAVPITNAINFTPRLPILVTEQQQMSIQQSSAAGGKLMLYGYLLPEDEALRLGYDIYPNSSPTDTSRLNYQYSILVDGTTQAFCPAIPGMCAQITDVYVRMQPLDDGQATLEIEDTDGTVLFKFCTSSAANPIERHLRLTSFFADAGKGIQVVGNASAANRATVYIGVRYVNQDQVPPEAFRGHITPAFPSPGSVTTGTTNVAKRQSSTLTLTYPRSGTTKTVPGDKLRHHVEGFHISVAKDATAGTSQDFMWAALTTGATGADVGFNGGFVDTGNPTVSPIFTGAMPYEVVDLAADEVNIPCKPDDGALHFDAMAVLGTLLATPTGEGDVADWSCSVWGRTLSTRNADTHEFTGSGL